MCKGKRNNKVEECASAKETTNNFSLFSRENFRPSSGFVCLTIGGLSYITTICLYFFGNNTDIVHVLRIVFEKVGDVFLVGAVLGYISNAAMYMGIFKKELEGVVLEEKFIEKLKPQEIASLWERITKKLFQSRFKGISSNLLSLIKDNYLPGQRSIYYSNYKSNVTIEWQDREKEIVKVTSVNHFKMVTESVDKFTVPWKSWTRVGNGAENPYSMQITKYKINGEDAELQKTDLGIVDGEHVFECKVSLEGSKVYDVQNVIEKIYSLREDFDKCFRAGYIVENYTLAVRYPDDMLLQFASRGTCMDFEIVAQSSNSLTAQYDGLILPKQGYVISIRLKNK